MLITSNEPLTSEIFNLCKSPCWIVMPPEKAHQLRANSFIEKYILPTQKPYRTMTWFDFHRGGLVPDACVQEKRLSFDCLKIVSTHEVEKKMKQPEARYFYLRKYLDQDYFLGVQSL